MTHFEREKYCSSTRRPNIPDILANFGRLKKIKITKKLKIKTQNPLDCLYDFGKKKVNGQKEDDI